MSISSQVGIWYVRQTPPRVDGRLARMCQAHNASIPNSFDAFGIAASQPGGVTPRQMQGWTSICWTLEPLRRTEESRDANPALHQEVACFLFRHTA